MSLQAADSFMAIFGLKRVENDCSTCKHSGPTTVYPKLYCWAFEIYTDKREQCVRWEVK